MVNGKESEKDVTYPLEIYHPSISAGDAAVIVTRDSDGKIAKTVLIDLGCNTNEFHQWCTDCIDGFRKRNAEAVVMKDGKEVKVSIDFDYVIVSHYHTDHYGGLNHKSIRANYLIHSYVNVKTNLSEKGRKYDGKNNPAKSVTLEMEVAKVCNLFEELSQLIIPEDKRMGDDPELSCLDINLTPNQNKTSESKVIKIELKCICANGIYRKDEKNWEAMPGNFGDWNDHSIAWLLEFSVGNEVTFRYFTAGDLSGSDKSGYTNIESRLIGSESKDFKDGYLGDKKVNLLKATHHGSMHSLSKEFLKCVKPEEIIVPCNNTHLLPFPQFFSRLDPEYFYKQKNKPLIYLTNFLQFKQQDYKQKAKISYDQVSFDENWFEFTSPKIKKDKTNYYYTASIDENKKAKLPVVKTEVDTSGKQKTRLIEDVSLRDDKNVENKNYGIEIEVHSPAGGAEELPKLWGKLTFFYDCIKLAYEAINENQPKKHQVVYPATPNDYTDLYILDEETMLYIEKDDVDVEKRSFLLKGFRRAFNKTQKKTNENSNKTIDKAYLAYPLRSSSRRLDVNKANAIRYFGKNEKDYDVTVLKWFLKNKEPEDEEKLDRVVGKKRKRKSDNLEKRKRNRNKL